MSWGEGLGSGEVSEGTVFAALDNTGTCLCICPEVHTLLCVAVFGYSAHRMDLEVEL